MNRQSGFTLTELMIVATIVAILLGIGLPSFKYVTTSNRMSSEVNSLLGDMQYARSEAVREGQTVTVCASTDGATCAGGVTPAWQSGWIVFSDANGNQTVDATDVVLRVKNRFGGQDTFSAAVGAVTFNREGFAVALPNAGLLMTLHDSTSNVGYTRCLQVGFVGSLKTQTHASLASCT